MAGLLAACGGLVERRHDDGAGASTEDGASPRADDDALPADSSAPPASVPPARSGEAPNIGTLTLRMRTPGDAELGIEHMRYLAWETRQTQPLAQGQVAVLPIVDDDGYVLLQASLRLPRLEGAVIRLSEGGCSGTVGPITMLPDANLTYEIRLTCP